MEECPCQSGKIYAECCQPLLTGTADAKTAEDLMRSRYSAFAKLEFDYLVNTLHPDKRDQHDSRSTEKWAQQSDWLGLEIIRTEDGNIDDQHGKVEFKAFYRQDGARKVHHELAEFEKADGKWFFVDGAGVQLETVVRETPKIGRNAPCPCNSGKKFKKCCGK